jgi:hypothetical protein
MLGVNTIKRLSKKGKLKLQSKLNNVSLRVRSRKVKKIIFLAMMSIIVTSACYTYPPSRRFILTLKSKVLKFNSANLNTELATTVTPSMKIDDDPLGLVAGIVVFTIMYDAIGKIYQIIL